LVKMALLQNGHLHTLKLGYNNLQDTGMALLAVGIAQARELKLIDLGFNNIGDEGCRILSSAIAQQRALVMSSLSSSSSSCSPVRTLYLAGNLIGQDGAMAIADLIRCSESTSCSTFGISGGNRRRSCNTFSALQKLYLTGNRLGPEGVSAMVEALLEDEQRRLEASVAAADEQEANTHVNNDENNNMLMMMDTSTLAASFQQQQHRRATLPRAEEKSTCSLGGGGGGGSGSSDASHCNRDNEIGVDDDNDGGMQELFLGGTRAGPEGCRAVARFLRHTSHLKVLSMPNCDFGDDDIAQLSLSIKANRDKLPLESLQLSFNRITYKGIEYLTNAIWGSLSMRELRLDNNEIGDRGVQQLATVLPFLRNLETLDVGFNGIQPSGMTLFMKAVAEATGLRSLSVSGNSIDTSASRAVAYALGYNRSLVSISLVHCSTDSESRRHITAGIVSNSNITIRDLSGFEMGPVVVTLGFPAPIEHWTNEQVLNFIHSMWDKCSEDVAASREEEKSLDPLHFLSSGPPSPAAGLNKSMSSVSSPNRNVPMDAAIVVDVAKKAYESLVQDGLDVFSRRPGHPNQPLYASPIAGDTIVVESTSASSLTEKRVNCNDIYPAAYATDTSVTADTTCTMDTTSTATDFASEPFPQFRAQSFVAAPETAVVTKHPAQRDPSRKKRIVEWLCHNIQHLNKLAQQPFSSAELWRLHQHYFAPVVNESGGNVGTLSAPAVYGGSCNGVSEEGCDDCNDHSALIASSVPEVSRANSSTGHHHHHHPNGDAMCVSAEESLSIPMSDPSINTSRQGVISSVPLLKRKVSYRFLGDAAAALASTVSGGMDTSTYCNATTNGGGGAAVSVSITAAAGGRLVPNMPTMPRKTKRARRNRSRISFVPRVKAKLDSYLDVCHEKALVTMRQLYFVEQAILSGNVNPIDPTTTTRTHLSGDSAIDAEIIIVDMI
jgi:Ran GTPase-activating protein (RanGAP) involved in mRNA processing and transport